MNRSGVWMCEGKGRGERGRGQQSKMIREKRVRDVTRARKEKQNIKREKLQERGKGEDTD